MHLFVSFKATKLRRRGYKIELEHKDNKVIVFIVGGPENSRNRFATVHNDPKPYVKTYAPITYFDRYFEEDMTFAERLSATISDAREQVRELEMQQRVVDRLAREARK